MSDPKRLTGTLVRIHGDGYGFIHTQEHGDYFVHVKELRDRADWVEGTQVSFVPAEGQPRKAPPATDVARVESA